MGVVTKGLIGRQDMAQWDGSGNKTFQRPTSTGGTATLARMGNEVDVLTTGGDGATYLGSTIARAMLHAGGKECSFVLAPGNWVIEADLTIPATIDLHVPRGAVLDIETGATLTINGGIQAGQYQIFDGEGTVTGTPTVPYILSKWYSDAASLTATLAGDVVDIGTMAAQAADDVAITGGAIEGVTISGLDAPLPVADGGTGAATAALARDGLGLGAIATKDAPLPVADGGTGATTAEAARTNLGVPYGIISDHEGNPTVNADTVTTLISTGNISVLAGVPYHIMGCWNGTKGATAGRVMMGLSQDTGTAVGFYGAGVTRWPQTSTHVVNGQAFQLTLTGLFIPIETGTIQLQLAGHSAASNSTDNECSLVIWRA
jgi:hypothetical protein